MLFAGRVLLRASNDDKGEGQKLGRATGGSMRATWRGGAAGGFCLLSRGPNAGAAPALTSPLLSFLCVLPERTAEEHRTHLLPSAKGQCENTMVVGGDAGEGAGEAQCLPRPCLLRKAEGGGSP